MLATSLFTPVFVQVMLTFVVIFWLARTRRQSRAENRASLNERELALGRHKWSDAATQASNNFKNQFEMPVLFFVGAAFALILRKTDVVLVSLAWAFVISRVVHALVHLGPNSMPLRTIIYALGVFILLAFWITLFLRVYGDPAFA